MHAYKHSNMYQLTVEDRSGVTAKYMHTRIAVRNSSEIQAAAAAVAVFVDSVRLLTLRTIHT
jgi:hypothetical protein